MRCTVWSGDLTKIRRKFQEYDLDLILDDGTLVGLQCCLQYSPKFGLSLKAVDADPTFALGELELRKKEILDRLLKEGLLEPNKKLIVPILPLKIGLITSKNSAAANDFINTLRQSGFGFQVYLADTIVQGNQAEQSVLKALNALEKVTLELLVIIRGGGSRTELFSLDNEAIAREIAAYRYPVWTGIGHETDVSILDHVANRYFKTPTAVAEELVARFVEMKRHLNEAENRFQSSWSYRLTIENKYLDRARIGIFQGTRKLIETSNAELKSRAGLLSSKVLDRLSGEKARLTVCEKILRTAPLNETKNQHRLLAERLQRISIASNRRIADGKRDLSNRINRFQRERFQQRITRERDQIETRKNYFVRVFSGRVTALQKELAAFGTRFRLEVFLKRLEAERISLKNKQAAIKATDPLTSLKRGFSLVYKGDNQLVKSIKSVSAGESVKTMLHDGVIHSKIERVKGK